MPDQQRPGQLIPTPHDKHTPQCSRRTGQRQFATGKKQGQAAMQPNMLSKRKHHGI
jgi:hypothetical protein